MADSATSTAHCIGEPTVIAARFIAATHALAEELVLAADATRGWQTSEKSEAIRSFRKRTKLLRATLSVLAQGEDRAVCDAALEILGEANRLLSPLRDHDVLRRSIRSTGALFPELEQRSVRTVLSAALLLHAPAGDDRAFEEAVLVRVSHAAQHVRNAVKSIGGLALKRRAIAKAIGSKWEFARRSLRVAIVTRDLPALHAARKEILAVAGCVAAWQGSSDPPRRVTRFTQLLARMARSLGEDRDFTLLSDRLVLHRERLASAEMLEAVFVAIADRRAKIQRGIRRDAKRLVEFHKVDLHTMLLDDLS